MAHRLTKIVTRTGDDGNTGLADGSRVGKHAPRIEAIGTIDELNSTLGLLLCEALPAAVAEGLRGIHNDLFDLGGELSLPGHALMSVAHTQTLDGMLGALNADLPPLEEFILPGGTRAASLAHVARTICRRAERVLVALHAAEPVSPASLHYLNRLSDLLFVMARVLNQGAQVEPRWQQGRNR